MSTIAADSGAPAGVEQLARVVRFVAGVLLVGVALAMIATIAGRYVGFSTAWADEAARIAFVWSACLGAASGLHRGLHFSVQLFRLDGPGPAQRLIRLLTGVLIVGASCVILWATTTSIPVAMKARLPALGISGGWFHGAIATFAVLSIVFALFRPGARPPAP